MADIHDVQQTVLDQINQSASGTIDPGQLLKLAEALAWLQRPAQSHGTGTASK